MPSEKDRRIYYQNIVYEICNILDEHLGKSVKTGTGLVCGTVDDPSREVQDAIHAICTENRAVHDRIVDEEIDRHA